LSIARTNSNTAIEITYTNDLVAGRKYKMKWGNNAVWNNSATAQFSAINSEDLERIFTADEPVFIQLALTSTSPTESGLLQLGGGTVTFTFNKPVTLGDWNGKITMTAGSETINVTLANGLTNTSIALTYGELTPETGYKIAWDAGVVCATGETDNCNLAFDRTFMTSAPRPIELTNMGTISAWTEEVRPNSLAVTWEGNLFNFAPSIEKSGIEDSLYIIVYSKNASDLVGFDPQMLVTAPRTSINTTSATFYQINGAEIYFAIQRATGVNNMRRAWSHETHIVPGTTYHLMAFAYISPALVGNVNTPPTTGSIFSKPSNVITITPPLPPAPPTLVSVTPNPSLRLPIEAGNIIKYQFDMDVRYFAGVATMIALDENGNQTTDTITIQLPSSFDRPNQTVIELTYNQNLAYGTQYRIAWNGSLIQNANFSTQTMANFFHIFTTESAEPLTGNSIHSFKVNGVDATINESARTITAELHHTTNLNEVEVVKIISDGAVATVGEMILDPTHQMDFSGSSPVEYVITSEAGESKTYTVTITKATVSIQNRQKISFEIYPNPANDVLNIRGENLKQIEIVNMLGQTVLKQENTNRIVVSNLKEGLYFIRLTTINNDVIIEKLVKK
jgi:hypothetical protein